MGLTRITSDGITDGAIAGSDLADQSVTLAKLPHGTSSNDGKFLRANNGADPTFEVVNTDLVADTSPQLGGDLDTNSFEINLDDSHAVNFGDSQDAEIKHTGANFVIRNTEGNIRIEPKNGELGIQMAPDDGVSLYFDNSKKFETTNAGATLTGSLTVTNDIHLEDNLLMGDTDKIRIGNSQDLEIVHDGSDSIINNATNNLFIRSGSLHLQSLTGENMVVGEANGAVELYYDNVKQFETHDDGVVLNGINQATAAHGQYDSLVLGKTGGNGGMTIVSGTNNSGTIAWADGSSGAGQYRAYLEYYHDTERMHLAVNTSVAMEWRTDQIISHEHINPSANNTYDLGSSSVRWRNIYTNDLNLSNEGGSNDVDGTWGSYTIQEGAEDLFLVNKRNGKKYKFNLTEV